MAIRHTRIQFSLLRHGICRAAERNDTVCGPDSGTAELLEWSQWKAVCPERGIPVRNDGHSEWRSHNMHWHQRHKCADLHERHRPFGGSIYRHRDGYEQNDQLRGCDKAGSGTGQFDEQFEFHAYQPGAYVFRAIAGAGDTNADEIIERAYFFSMVAR